MNNLKLKEKSNQKGQGLIEYLIIVALIGVAAIGIMRSLQGSVNTQYANVVRALQGGNKKKIKTEIVDESEYKKKDLSSFMKNTNTGNQKD